MALGRYLADKSAFEQQRHSDAAGGLLSALATDGALYMTEIVALELLYSARGSNDYDARREDLLTRLRQDSGLRKGPQRCDLDVCALTRGSGAEM